MASRSVVAEEVPISISALSTSALIPEEELLRVRSGTIRVLAVYSSGVPRTTIIPITAPMPHALNISFLKVQTFRITSGAVHACFQGYCVIFSLFDVLLFIGIDYIFYN